MLPCALSHCLHFRCCSFCTIVRTIILQPTSVLAVRLSCFLMPTAAELALQKKYAELRAKKQKVSYNGLRAETQLIIFRM